MSSQSERAQKDMLNRNIDKFRIGFRLCLQNCAAVHMIPFCYINRKNRRHSDVSSLISALDTTLKMTDLSADHEAPDAIPEEGQEEVEEQRGFDIPDGKQHKPVLKGLSQPLPCFCLHLGTIN